LQSGGRVNVQKAAEIVIHEFRSASMGPMTLETPAEFAQWMLAGEKHDAERQLKKDALATARLIRLKKVKKTSQ
jgi:ribosome biogenesis GTPase A